MESDPQVRALLERAASDVVVDTDQAFDAIVRAPAPRRPIARVVALAATVGLLVLLVAVAVLMWPGSNDHGFVREGNEPAGMLALARRTDPSGTEPGSGVFAYRFAERVPKRLAQGMITDAAWSPDGARIAYTVELDQGARYALVVARADGSQPITLVEHEKGDASLPGPDFISVAWSPDGSRLAYSGRTIYRGRTVSVLDADGSDERVLAGHWEAVSWSPDGRRLLLLGWPDVAREGRFDLYTMRPDGSDLVQLTDDPTIERDPAWSPDGSTIAYSGDAGGAGDTDPDIFVMNADGSDQTRLTPEPGFDVVPVWSPDGKWIAFASERDSTPERRRAAREGQTLADLAIFVMRPDGSDVRRVLHIVDDIIFPLSWTF